MFYNIPGYIGYRINESGVVIDEKERMLRFSVDNHDRMYVTINRNIEYIDILVAKTFLPNPDNLKYVAHRNGELLNNHLSNLYWSEKPEIIERDSIIHKRPKTIPRYKYEIYNENGDSIICQGREEVAKFIEYEVISLKNMVGNERIISKGPYTGYKIRRLV